ncbi:sigma-70 family RNA polymerase sigma factor [Halomonas llamarensis]|uniref:Sigma-70 family RNA polymerase sigma factor n=1 Tax=Halomonas llamarensis TaxID=2945104 RepID=A0ABT0SRA7_9GAMM|nr:sigma-70 family RNA polymerase sigma factor [Halomonas llamarensis]MCL7930359.1 sigma-70 family RNA polymerase sigma factor [Halomonas llamarensis]
MTQGGRQNEADSQDEVTQWYREHHGWLNGLLQYQLGCRDTAADLAQDTFVRLIVRGLDTKAIHEPRAFLRTIAKGLLANHWRRQDIERAYLEALSAWPQAHTASPEDRHAVLQSLYRIDAMLHGLPDKVRQAFLMSRLEGVSYAEIGECLGVSERMIKKYMAQAMLQCLRLVDEELA